MLHLSYTNSKSEPLTKGFTIPCDKHNTDRCLEEAEQYFSQGKDYILRDGNNVTVIAHAWHYNRDVYYAKLEEIK